MRIGDDNLFEIQCRTCITAMKPVPWTKCGVGVECPSIGNSNTISTRSRVHHTVRLSSHCVIGAGVLLVPTEDETLDPFTVVFGPAAERRTWSGRGRAQEADLRKKHAEYLRETLPKFNRLRKDDARSTHAEAPSPSR